MEKPKATTVEGIFLSDTRRYHRFEIKGKDDHIVGNLYVAKGEEVPDVVEVRLVTKATGEKEEKL